MKMWQTKIKRQQTLAGRAGVLSITITTAPCAIRYRYANLVRFSICYNTPFWGTCQGLALNSLLGKVGFYAYLCLSVRISPSAEEGEMRVFYFSGCEEVP